MTWIFVALAGYFFNAVAAIFDKFLLSDRIKAPAAYAFYVSLFSLFVLVFAPFALRFFGWQPALVAFFSGVIFLYALVAFYKAVMSYEVSRVSPLVGTVTSLVAFATAFSMSFFGGEAVRGIFAFLGLILLISGGFLVSFDLPLRKGEYIPLVDVALAGIGMGLSFLFLKQAYDGSDFMNGFIWSRIGMFAGGLSLLLIPTFRHQIFGHSEKVVAVPRRAMSTGIYFILNKMCAGIGAFLIAYAISLGSVSFVQALSGLQYIFILSLAFPLSFWYPKVYGEKLLFWDWFQKFAAIVLIGLGLFLAASSGIKLLV